MYSFKYYIIFVVPLCVWFFLSVSIPCQMSIKGLTISFYIYKYFAVCSFLVVVLNASLLLDKRKTNVILLSWIYHSLSKKACVYLFFSFLIFVFYSSCAQLLCSPKPLNAGSINYSLFVWQLQLSFRSISLVTKRHRARVKLYCFSDSRLVINYFIKTCAKESPTVNSRLPLAWD